MKKPGPLPLTKDIEEADKAVLDQLDVLAKKVERLTGFAVRRNDPASADFLMSVFAGQLVWNDINARVSILFANVLELQDERTRQCRAATAELREARGELDKARKDLRKDVQVVAAFYREQLTADSDRRGAKTLLGLMNSSLLRFEGRLAKVDAAVQRRCQAVTSALARLEQLERQKAAAYGPVRKAWMRLKQSIGIGPMIAICLVAYIGFFLVAR